MYGAGTIGIVTALAALASGCSQVILTDVKEGKLALASRHYPKNLRCVNSGRESLSEAVRGVAAEGADIVFEASGSPAAFEGFTEHLRPGGRAVLIGMPAGPAPFDVVGAQAKEISFHTIFRYRNMYPRTLKLMSSGSIDAKPLVTHRFGFENALAAFDFAAGGPEDAIKILVEL